jgi:DNA-directed RNA polymerase specialized sigma24 family protein
MWKGLPKFRWESTLRVWAYRIARNEFLHTARATTRAKREVPVSEVMSALIARVKSTTPLHERSDVKDRFSQLRAALDPEDHMLLGLRLDRRMAWTDIAKVLGEEETGSRATAALRNRFERLKARLRSAAKAT